MRSVKNLIECVLFFGILPAITAAQEPSVPEAIKKGVKYLHGLQKPDGTWPRQEIGATALAALTLLECEVPASDPSIQKAAAVVREAALDLTHTYSLALSILLLDHLQGDLDVPLIESMTARLIAGQTNTGGWSYTCPRATDKEVRQLIMLLHKPRHPVEKKPESKTESSRSRKWKKFTREIHSQLAIIHQQAASGPGDNSNTQFATLALWVARRYDLPVQNALSKVEARFRASQNADGGWSYLPNENLGSGLSTATMTCAGLISLAVAHGIHDEAPIAKDQKAETVRRLEPGKDPKVRAALMTLASAIGNPLGNVDKERASLLLVKERGYYFLWSLERVGVVFGLKTIGKKNWYEWGVELLLASQKEDGSWQGEYADGGVDTCFALLFLRRANFFKDLTENLLGRVTDPGAVSLKAGGIGGKTLLSQGVPLGGKPGETSPNETNSKRERPLRKGQPVTPDDIEMAATTDRLSDVLVHSSPGRQKELIDQYKQGKGIEYTYALAKAIRGLKGSAKNHAQESLAERSARMTFAILEERLSDDDAELRRAAALALAMREEKKSIAKLIGLLNDSDESVARAALAALKSLTGKDFGPKFPATSSESSTAAESWNRWWKQQDRGK